ncbi:hypothetical protein N656DRAFT_773878 [Canariomyces notabilis]|uniref:Uncharacterized protein n=1 Tax=Canariomyces notabilis TaxID=2074819 RepID=A0AAN6YXZ9_9PEZI|nr:hypothetical protein N656DRAFT_773878 [Canariomyces arenarius]
MSYNEPWFTPHERNAVAVLLAPLPPSWPVSLSTVSFNFSWFLSLFFVPDPAVIFAQKIWGTGRSQKPTEAVYSSKFNQGDGQSI